MRSRYATRRDVHVAVGAQVHMFCDRPHGALPQGTRRALWDALMDCASDADLPEVQALAGVLAAAFDTHGTDQLPLAGLGAAETRRLLARWFPGADAVLALDWRTLSRPERIDARQDEIEDLVDLLTEPAPPSTARREETRWLARALGQASLGQDHLWQDLHLPSRGELSALMVGWFPSIASRNDRDMKWKKFLYKQLCDRAQLSICRAPSCGVCSDYARCYGPEDAATASRPPGR